MEAMIGVEASDQIQRMIEGATNGARSGFFATIVGTGVLLFGATGFFVQLQEALNRAWDVPRGERKHGFKGMIVKRFLSFGMVLVIAFLLLISLVVSAALGALSEAIRGWL